MTSKKKTKAKAQDELRAWLDSVGDVEGGVLASNAPLPSEKAVRAAQHLVGRLPATDASPHVARVATLLDRLAVVAAKKPAAPSRGSSGRKATR